MTALAYQLPIAHRPTNPGLVLLPAPHDMAMVYRRRRIAAVALLFTLTLALGYGISLAVEWVTAQSAQPVLIADVSAAGPSEYTVAKGDTLWSIVTAAYPNEDPRPVIAELKATGVGTDLQVGQTITLP